MVERLYVGNRDDWTLPRVPINCTLAPEGSLTMTDDFKTCEIQRDHRYFTHHSCSEHDVLILWTTLPGQSM